MLEGRCAPCHDSNFQVLPCWGELHTCEAYLYVLKIDFNFALKKSIASHWSLWTNSVFQHPHIRFKVCCLFLLLSLTFRSICFKHEERSKLEKLYYWSILRQHFLKLVGTVILCATYVLGLFAALMLLIGFHKAHLREANCAQDWKCSCSVAVFALVLTSGRRHIYLYLSLSMYVFSVTNVQRCL